PTPLGMKPLNWSKLSLGRIIAFLEKLIKFQEKAFVALANSPSFMCPVAVAAKQQVNGQAYHGEKGQYQQPTEALGGFFATEEDEQHDKEKVSDIKK
ncbi:MAG TPA: hypothetical protein VJZ70_03685, partial [Limnochordia bacterium]|nr:hypothetical protein [Limnochordia bacterium]